MAISDEQRRKVAAKMRECDVAEFKESAIVPFLECLGYAYKDWRGILDGLADLIDRPTCKNSEYLYDGSFFECSECGERWELTCGGPADNHLCFCPRCGAEVVS